MKKCAFCDHNDFKNQIIHESPLFIAIQARRPLSKGHIIIFPKRHTNDFNFNESESIELLSLINNFVSVFKQKLNSDGVNVFSNLGPAAGQEIMHLHVHLVSRCKDEKESPFVVLNNREKYNNLPRLNPEEMSTMVDLLKIS